MKMHETNRLALKMFVFLVTILPILPPAVEAESPEQHSNYNEIKETRAQFVPDEIILKLRPEALVEISITTDANKNVVTGIFSLDSLNKKYGVTKMKRILDKVGTKPKRKLSPKAGEMRQQLFRIYKIKLKPGTDVLEAISEYQKDPNVEYAEANYIYRTNSTIPNDVGFVKQWGLHNTGQNEGTPDADIDAPEAWDIETGDPNVIIAVVDTGIDWAHPDLAANIWINPGEVADNGKDDDDNGYIDDYRGWDFVSVSADSVYSGEDPGPPDNDPMDSHGHGTHVSGIIGALTDNNKLGIAGVAWLCKVMAVRAGYKGTDGHGHLETSDIINAITYATDNGANIINMSFGGTYPSAPHEEAIDCASAAGVTLIAASGNAGCNCKEYPAYYENVVAVGATDNNDNVANFSNYGWWIDVVAPGVDIFSTWPGNNYKSLNGTSMAAPHVSGLAGLILSKNPGLSNEEVRQVFRVSAEDLGVSGWDEYFGYGRINAYNSLQLDSVCISRIDLGDVIQGTIDIIGTASGTEFDHYTVYYGEGIDPSNWTQIGMTSYGQVSEGTLASWDTTTVDDGQYMLKLVVVSSDSNEFVDRKVIVVDNEDLSYVPDDFSTIQSAIDGSADGDTVWVRSGTYLDSIDFSGKAIAVRSLNGPDVTIIDGDGVDFDTMVRFSSGEDENAILNGFTITNGNDSGIKCIMSSPRIADCIISGNSAKSGGGIYCEFSSPMIANCTISGNSCTGLGGGIYCYLSSPMITNCTMSGNSAKSGGGIYCGGDSSPSITNCTISGNSATTAIGGGLLFAESSPTISNCTISGNSAKGDGGGICCWSSSPMITNCTMSANSGDYGGGICSNLSSLSITNCTINGNSAAASNKGGGVFCWRSSLTVVNSILWGDTAGGSPNEIDLFQDCSIDITYSAIEGGWGTQEEMETNHNLAADPRLGPFSDLGWPRMGYFPLMVGSPAIDAGDDHYCPETDQRGQHRPMDGDGDGISICDIGAYEFTNERNNPSVAYNADNNRYLLVYDSASWSYPGKADICGQLTDYDGTPLGSEFVISGAVDDQRRPLVAYDSGNKRFLVVWTDLRNRESSSSDIYGQIVNGNGSLYGANLLISNAAKMQDRPTVAYDSVNRRFFVAWQDYRNKETTRYDVYGQIVDANGTLDGNEFVISDGSDNQTWPKAAYDSANERFLVVWSDYRNRQSTSYDIYGQILNADGTRYGGGELVIIVADRYQSSPSVAYDSVNQRFLVVWNDGRGGEITRCDIYGQILNASGATCGNDFVICDDLVIFAGEHQYEPSVAYDSVNQRFLVVWTDQRNIGTTGGYHVLGNTDIYGQRVKPDGTLLCGNFAISDAPDTQTYPTVAYNSENNNFLVAFNTHEIGPIEEVVPEIGFAVVRQPGDLDGDGDVDYDDYLLFRTAYGSCSGDGNFIPEADLDGDGCVTINDYRILRTLM